MRKSKITALAFLISGVLLTICCFLPLKTMVIESSFLNETEIIRFMPSFGGFLILILALGCVIFPIVGYKQQSAMVGTISALVGGGLLWYYSANAGRAEMAVGQVDTIMSAAFGSGTDSTSVTITTNFGFYLTILALVLVLITGFAYTLSEDD